MYLVAQVWFKMAFKKKLQEIIQGKKTDSLENNKKQIVSGL